MKPIVVTILVTLAVVVGAQLIFNSLFKDVRYVHACRPNEPITDCRTYKADIAFEPMDGPYVTAMHPDNRSTITFDPISLNDSKEQGCWLGNKKGGNDLVYNVCNSSDGEWIILEGPLRQE